MWAWERMSRSAAIQRAVLQLRAPVPAATRWSSGGPAEEMAIACLQIHFAGRALLREVKGDVIFQILGSAYHWTEAARP